MDRSYNNYNNSMGKSQIVDVSSKVMLASIIILFLIIVLVIVLHFYAKWYWRRRIGNQNGGTLRRRFVFTPSQDQNVTFRQGLAASVVTALPIVTFSSTEFKDGLECAVCLSEVEEGEKARVLPKCNHGFHVDCIDMWFQSHSTCPLCRNPVSVESASPSPVDSSDIESQSSPVNSGNNNNNGLLSVEANPSYPTNVMFWGNQTRVSTRDSGEEETSSSSDSSSPSLRPDRPLVIDIPDRLSHGFSFSSPPTTPSSAGRRVSENDMKSPVSSRFKSLCKLLSREKRVVPSSPSVDIEQGEVVGSSKMSSPAGYAIGTSTTTGKERSPSPEEMNNNF
ncbi:hypothetical protein C5167_026524 [Papaver somniferum]|uniref:RING-H2 finger protein ATL3-like n=1 Tax=Papaver somniferum TaxID=3469 RepID=UPI000E7029F9|nr:RING-H2 finger protein ATL3-like [Papaver somniferum]RZC85847.1 hypothetical protein C5167_026524 [Papaver somniferum]